MARLEFDAEQLRGKTNSVQLAKRLQALHEQLAGFEQGSVERDSVESVAAELVSNALLLHKDRSVKAFVACCLADILKLLAPEAPYSEQEIRDIFAFIFRQLKNIGKPNDAHASQYAYVLDSIANAKSAALVCELPGADEQISDAFKDFLASVGTPELSQNTRGCMTDILCQLVDEAPTVPQDAVDQLLTRLLPKNARNKTPSYHMAIQIFRHVAERLHRHVSAYFTDVFNQIQESLVEEGDADLDELATAHELIKELNRAAPQVLLNVVPQLEEQLQSNHVSLRMMAAKSLGSMFAEHAGMLDHLARRYPSTWKAWLGRSNDRDHNVRLVVLEALKPIWVAHPALVQQDLEKVLSSKLLDPDEKVRCAACAVLSTVDLELVLRHVDISLLHALSERIKDKKPSVSYEALKALGRLYNLAFPDIVGGDAITMEKLNWIPDVIFRSSTIISPGVINAVESVVLDYVLPLPARADDLQAWVDRFIFVYASVSSPSQQNMLRLTRIAERRPTAYDGYLKACQDNNGGIIDEDEEKKKRMLNLIIDFLSRTFPDPKRAKEDLHKFAKMNENRLYKLLKTLMDPQTDLKTLLKTYPETLRRIETSSSSILDTFRTFIRRSSMLLLNKSAIPHLLKKTELASDLDESNEESASIASTILGYMAKRCPSLFKTFQEDLVLAVDADAGSKSREIALLAASELQKVDSSAFSDNQRLAAVAFDSAIDGKGEEPKFAASFLARHDATRASDLLWELSKQITDTESTKVVSQLKAVVRLCRDLPQASDAFDELHTLAMHLLNDEAGIEKIGSDDEEWAPESKMTKKSQARVLSVKLLANLCLSISKAGSAASMASPIISLLFDRADANTNTQLVDAAHIRLSAGKALLKLCTVQVYEKEILKRQTSLALLAQDSSFEVRNGYLKKLAALLSSRQLCNPVFNLVLFVYAHDPEPENIALVKLHVEGRMRSMTQDDRVQNFDMLLIRFLHLVAHHPDFGRDTEDLMLSARYIEFFLECVVNADNVSLLNHLMVKVRTVRDAESQGHSENLYILAELGQRILAVMASKNSWPVQTYPGKIKLPADIFKALPSQEVQNELAKRNWLEPSVADAVLQSLKSSKSEGKRKATPSASDLKSKSKRSKTTPRNEEEKKQRKASKPRRNKAEWEEEGSEESLSDVPPSDDEGEQGDTKTPLAKKTKPKPKPRTAGDSEKATRRSGRGVQRINYASDQENAVEDSLSEVEGSENGAEE